MEQTTSLEELFDQYDITSKTSSSRKIIRRRAEEYKDFFHYLNKEISFSSVFSCKDTTPWAINKSQTEEPEPLKINTKCNFWYANYWSLLNNNFITPIANNEKRMSIVITEKFTVLEIVKKIYLSDMPDYINVDILLNTQAYTNKELESLLDKELEVGDQYNNLLINFNYLNIADSNIHKDSVLIFENNG
ncbi:hypothetical protein KKE68_07320 [Patescibacteria group bacterium]|nr:hypothetical protein [Patescibacteria group bacterium]